MTRSKTIRPICDEHLALIVLRMLLRSWLLTGSIPLQTCQRIVVRPELWPASEGWGKGRPWPSLADWPLTLNQEIRHRTAMGEPVSDDCWAGGFGWSARK